MWFRFTRREWAAVLALVALLAAGVLLNWPDERSGVQFVRVESKGVSLLPGVPGRVDINRATAEELTVLSGVGAVKARNIVEYRREHGPFRSIGQLENVSGIGPATLDRMRPYVTTGSDVPR